MKYCKEVEVQLQQAVAEKIKENLVAVLEKIEKENILIEPKMLNDAKNFLSKMKWWEYFSSYVCKTVAYTSSAPIADCTVVGGLDQIL